MIDPTQFEYADSRWQDLYKYLKDKGYEVYAPGQHEGECLSKYIVVKYDGESYVYERSSRRDLYNIMVYVPKDNYFELEGFVQSVKTDLKEIFPLFMQYDQQASTSAFDPACNGHFVSLEYANIKKN